VRRAWPLSDFRTSVVYVAVATAWVFP